MTIKTQNHPEQITKLTKKNKIKKRQKINNIQKRQYKIQITHID